jgi:hypothetical protein
VLVPLQDGEDDLPLDDLGRGPPEQARVERRSEPLAGVRLEAQPASEGLARGAAQNIRPPRGTSEVGRSRITRPSSSGICLPWAAALAERRDDDGRRA